MASVLPSTDPECQATAAYLTRPLIPRFPAPCVPFLLPQAITTPSLYLLLWLRVSFAHHLHLGLEQTAIY